MLILRRRLFHIAQFAAILSLGGELTFKPNKAQ